MLRLGRKISFMTKSSWAVTNSLHEICQFFSISLNEIYNSALYFFSSAFFDFYLL